MFVALEIDGRLKRVNTSKLKKGDLIFAGCHKNKDCHGCLRDCEIKDHINCKKIMYFYDEFYCDKCKISLIGTPLVKGDQFKAGSNFYKNHDNEFYIHKERMINNNIMK